MATDAVREGEVGCFFDEIGNLVEPTERPDMDVPAGRSEAGCQSVAAQSVAVRVAPLTRRAGRVQEHEGPGQSENTAPSLSPIDEGHVLVTQRQKGQSNNGAAGIR